MRSSPLSSLRARFALLLVVLGLTVLAYSNTFQASFHFDDNHQIAQSQHITKAASILRFFVSGEMGSYREWFKLYRPVTQTTFAVNYAVSGLEVWSYHLFNLAVHCLNVLLVYVMAAAVLRRLGGEEGPFTSLFIALVFALHPIQTGAVTYISGRAVILSSFFSLLSLLCFLRYREGGPKGLQCSLFAAAPLFFYLALLSKEVAVSVLGLMLLYDFVSAGVSGKVRGKIAEWGLVYLVFAGVFIFYLVSRNMLLGFPVLGRKYYGVAENLMSQAKVLFLYVRLMLLPVRQNFDYNLPVTRALDFQTALAGFLILGALAALVMLRKRSPTISFFGLWFFVTIAPESSLIPLRNLAVEYRLYLPMAGFTAAVILTTAKLFTSPRLRRFLALSIVVLLAAATYSRNKVFATEYTLWRDVVEKSPYSARAHSSYGKALLLEKNYDEAIREFELALDIDPEYDQRYGVFSNIGIAHLESGRLPEAFRYFKRAVKVYPKFFAANYFLAVLYSRNHMDDKALEHARIALRHSGNDRERGLASSLIVSLRK